MKWCHGWRRARDKERERESASPPPPPPPPPSSLLTKSSKGVKMPADIMRLWSLPLPPTLFSSSLLHSSALLVLRNSFLRQHFPLSFVGGVMGFAYESRRYCALYLHRVILHARRKLAMEIFLSPSSSSSSSFFIVSLIVFFLLHSAASLTQK